MIYKDNFPHCGNLRRNSSIIPARELCRCLFQNTKKIGLSNCVDDAEEHNGFQLRVTMFTLAVCLHEDLPGKTNVFLVYIPDVLEDMRCDLRDGRKVYLIDQPVEAGIILDPAYVEIDIDPELFLPRRLSLPGDS